MYGLIPNKSPPTLIFAWLTHDGAISEILSTVVEVGNKISFISTFVASVFVLDFTLKILSLNLVYKSPYNTHLYFPSSLRSAYPNVPVEKLSPISSNLRCSQKKG